MQRNYKNIMEREEESTKIFSGRFKGDLNFNLCRARFTKLSHFLEILSLCTDTLLPPPWQGTDDSSKERHSLYHIVSSGHHACIHLCQISALLSVPSWFKQLLGVKLDCKEDGSRFSNSRMSMLSLSNVPNTDKHYDAVQCSLTFPRPFPVNHYMHSMVHVLDAISCTVNHIFSKSNS